jgi:hypothetical protein
VSGRSVAIAAMAMEFKFNATGGKRTAEPSNTQGSDAKGSRKEQLMTPEGVDVSSALEKLTLLCGNNDMRIRNLEAVAYITVEVLPNHPQLISGMEGTRQQNAEVLKANKERWTKAQKKEIGGPQVFVAFKWLADMGAQGESFANKAKEQLSEIFALAQDVHFMDQVFSHSQSWLGKDKQFGFIRFKMHPWFKELEEAFVQFLKRGGKAIIKGQSAPRGYKVIDLEETMEPIKGKGKGKREENNEDLY